MVIVGLNPHVGNFISHPSPPLHTRPGRYFYSEKMVKGHIGLRTVTQALIDEMVFARTRVHFN